MKSKLIVVGELKSVGSSLVTGCTIELEDPECWVVDDDFEEGGGEEVGRDLEMGEGGEAGEETWEVRSVARIELLFELLDKGCCSGGRKRGLKSAYGTVEGIQTKRSELPT